MRILRTCGNRRGFTLIEIMIVVGMIAIIMAFGIPSMVENMKRGPMRQAVKDILEACQQARASAIQGGKMAELSFSSDGRISTDGFSATLDRDILVDMIDVNTVDMRQEKEVRVRFYPNGTSDDFNLLIRSTQQEFRRFHLDVVTGLVEFEVIR